MNEHNANVERTEHGDIQEDVGEVLVGDNGAVNADDERLLPELGDVLQDAAQVCEFHFSA